MKAWPGAIFAIVIGVAVLAFATPGPEDEDFSRRLADAFADESGLTDMEAAVIPKTAPSPSGDGAPAVPQSSAFPEAADTLSGLERSDGARIGVDVRRRAEMLEDVQSLSDVLQLLGTLDQLRESPKAAVALLEAMRVDPILIEALKLMAGGTGSGSEGQGLGGTQFAGAEEIAALKATVEALQGQVEQIQTNHEESERARASLREQVVGMQQVRPTPAPSPVPKEESKDVDDLGTEQPRVRGARHNPPRATFELHKKYVNAEEGESFALVTEKGANRVFVLNSIDLEVGTDGVRRYRVTWTDMDNGSQWAARWPSADRASKLR